MGNRVTRLDRVILLERVTLLERVILTLGTRWSVLVTLVTLGRETLLAMDQTLLQCSTLLHLHCYTLILLAPRFQGSPSFILLKVTPPKYHQSEIKLPQKVMDIHRGLIVFGEIL